MNTPTNFGKFGLRSQPWRAFFALFTILVGMGASQVAQAQSVIISNSNVFVDNTAGSANTTYGGNSGVLPAFHNANLGTFNINSPGSLLLNGGELTTTESSTIVQGATITFDVFNKATGSSVSGGFQTITLQETTPTSSPSGVRTFSLADALKDLVSYVPDSNPAPSGVYGVELFFNAQYNSRLTERTASVVANFTVTGARAAPSTITLRTVSVTNNNGTGGVARSITASSYNANPNLAPGPGVFQGTYFGDFNVDAGRLIYNGGTVDIAVRPGDVFDQAFIDFRVFQGGLNTDANPSSFITVQLDTVGAGPKNGIRRFRLATEVFNVIQLVVANGNGGTTFRFDVRPRAVGTNAIGNAINLGGEVRSSTFTVNGTIPTAATTTQWKGNGTDNWFLVSNWTNGVPGDNTNVLIPDFGAELGGVVYPNIKDTDAPFVDGISGARVPAKSRSLAMGGSTQAQRAICRLVSGRLQVFGDFNNRLASFIQRGDVAPASVIEFAGNRLQTISSGSFTRVELSGLGDKRVTNRMFVGTSIRFLTGADGSTLVGNITTDITDPDRSFVELADRDAINLQNGAQLTGETSNSHIVGFVQTRRSAVLVGEARTYGNIGMELTFIGTNNPGNIIVTRNTAENYAPVANRYGIRRIFGVRPTDPGAQFGGVAANMRFYYLDSETQNLRTDPSIPSTQQGTGTLTESTLALYLSTNSGNSFTKLGRDGAVNTTQNYLDKSNVRSFATFTLADENPAFGLPLPVVLAAFDVNRAGTDAILTWATATEKNSKGFNVQVSTDGKSFRTIGFVASVSANSSQPQYYRFVDVTATKTGVRYYRLNQVDLDGIDSLSPVKVVDFGATAPVSVATTLLAYPNPFTSDLSVSVGGAGIGKANLRLADLTGRTIRSQVVSLEGGSGTIPLTNLGELKAGVYLVQLTLPSGKTQNFKVQKQ